MRNNAQMFTSTLMPMFVKKHHEVFLVAGLGIVSSFNTGKNQINSILRGHWGKKLVEEKTGLNPILPKCQLFLRNSGKISLLSCLFWAFKVKLLLDVLNLVLVSFMAVSILGLFFKTLAGLSLFFLTKIVSVVLKDLK